MATLDEQIQSWRTAVMRDRAVDEADADELESHLREQIAELENAGMTDDEAFLIAIRRIGQVNEVAAEFAREHGDRLWKQLTVTRSDEVQSRPFVVMLGFAVLAAALVQLARLLQQMPVTETWFLPALTIFDVPVVSASLFTLTVLAAYFAVRRALSWRVALGILGAVVVLAVVINLFPFARDADTAALVAGHLPVLLWLLVGVAFTGGDWRSSAKRMDFIRFSGEWAIYFVLIALGGAVLMALTLAVLVPIAPDAAEEVARWVVPSGAAGATVVSAWLVEEKKSIIENIAPVLTAIFTPLFAVMLVVATVIYFVGGIGVEFDRELLTQFDILLFVVVGLVVYGISARDRARGPGIMAVIQLIAVIAAIVLDLLVLISILTRIGEFGFTPNRTVALGLNVLLLVNLAGTAYLSIRMLGGRERAARLENWQTGYLIVFAAWAAVVVLALPPLFGFA